MTHMLQMNLKVCLGTTYLTETEKILLKVL